MGCKLSKDNCFLTMWYQCTDCCHKTTVLRETEISTINKLYLCSYPYCHNLTNWNYRRESVNKLPGDVKFIRFRGNIYCSTICKEKHKGHNYYGSVDMVSSDDYVDL